MSNNSNFFVPTLKKTEENLNFKYRNVIKLFEKVRPVLLNIHEHELSFAEMSLKSVFLAHRVKLSTHWCFCHDEVAQTETEDSKSGSETSARAYRCGVHSSCLPQSSFFEILRGRNSEMSLRGSHFTGNTVFSNFNSDRFGRELWSNGLEKQQNRNFSLKESLKMCTFADNSLLCHKIQKYNNLTSGFCPDFKDVRCRYKWGKKTSKETDLLLFQRKRPPSPRPWTFIPAAGDGGALRFCCSTNQNKDDVSTDSHKKHVLKSFFFVQSGWMLLSRTRITL